MNDQPYNRLLESRGIKTIRLNKLKCFLFLFDDMIFSKTKFLDPWSNNITIFIQKDIKVDD